MTPRTDTSALIAKCQAIAAAVVGYDQEFSKLLGEVVDRLEEQEATIRALRSELVELAGKAMSQEDTIRHLRVEICNASAKAMQAKTTLPDLSIGKFIPW